MKTKVFILTVLFVLFSFPISCWANPRPPFHYPAYANTTLVRAIIISGSVDFLVLGIGYLIIKNIRVVASWHFLLYFILVVVGGFLIDFIATLFPGNGHEPLIIGLNAGVLLFFYNSYLSRTFFKLGYLQAAIIGLLMAILTNPVIATIVINGSYPDPHLRLYKYSELPEFPPSN